jgi:hypothetical protein
MKLKLTWLLSQVKTKERSKNAKEKLAQSANQALKTYGTQVRSIFKSFKELNAYVLV